MTKIRSELEAQVRTDLEVKVRAELESKVRAETETAFTEINDMRDKAFHEVNNARNKNKQKEFILSRRQIDLDRRAKEREQLFQQREQQLQQKEYDLSARVMIWEPLLPFIEESVRTGLVPADMKSWIHSRREIERIEKVDSETAAILLAQRFEQNLQLGNIEQRLTMGQTTLRMQDMTMWQNQIEIFRAGSENGFNPGQQATTQPEPQQITPPPDQQTISPQQAEAIENLIRQGHSQDRSMREYLANRL